MNIPTTIKKDEDKVKFLYRALELLRLEHNKLGADFVAGKIIEKEFRDYQRNDIRGRQKNVLHEINKIKEAEEIFKIDILDVDNPKRKWKEEGIKETKWDKEIDIKTIEKAGKGIEIFDPLEDFTGYTEVDPNSKITVATNKITYTGLQKNADAYVYKDKGANHFDGDFEHLVTSHLTSTTGTFPSSYSWVLANVVNDMSAIDVSAGVGIWFNHFHYGGVNYCYLQETISGQSAAYDGYNGSIDTTYYLTIERDESVGTYGTLYCYIYSNSNRSTLLDTLSVTLRAKSDFRYIYPLNTFNGGGSETMTGYVENLDLQEAVGTNIKINIGDTFKDVSAISINIGDVWKSVTSIKQNIADVWKNVF